jgi:DNA-binding response OmpR family regulator
MPKVLVVDDDNRLRMNISDWLEHQRFEVEEAKNGSEAKDLLATYVYDVVVLDWNLPDADGLEVCRWFRGRGGSTPILMLTGKDLIQDKVTSFDAGVDDYLTKPFDMQELTARLNALMRRGGAVAPTRVLNQGGLMIDPEKHLAKIDGNAIQLTPKEFDVLEFLARHPERVFSAETIMDRLWKADAEISPDTVRVYMKRLREKLEKHGRGALIKTIHGVGYKFSPGGET